MKKYVWATVTAFIFLLVFSWTTSPLYAVYGNDSPFFQIIGLGVLQGKIPYVDLFDHKGPLIFFANTLGYSLGLGKTGLFVLQVVNLSIALVLFYKIAGLFCKSPRKAYTAVALALIPLIDFIIEGNQCEEWMLPWEAGALFLVCRSLLPRSGLPAAAQQIRLEVESAPAVPAAAGKLKPSESFMLGVIFAVMFYIRPNDGVMWIGGMYFGLFLLWIVRKMYRQILPGIACFLAGFCIVTVPILAYFIGHDAFGDLIKGMLLHNIQYAGDAIFTWGGIGMILIPVLYFTIMLILTARDNQKDFRYILIPVLALVILFIGKRDYYHYLLPLIPFIVMCNAICLNHNWKAFLWISCVLFGIFSFREFKCIVKAIAIHDEMTEFYSQTDSLFEMVPEDERNNIWNYNLFTLNQGHSPHMKSLVGAYLHKGLTPSNAAFVYFQMDYAYPESEYGIMAGKPEWVLMQPSGEFNKDFDYIFQNYDLVGATPSEPVCEIRLYHRR